MSDNNLKQELNAIYARDRAVLQYMISSDLFHARYHDKTFVINDYRALVACGNITKNAFCGLSSAPFDEVMNAGKAEEISHV